MTRSPNHIILKVADVKTGAYPVDTAFDVSTPPGDEVDMSSVVLVDPDQEPIPEIKKWGTAAWGFSPDDNDARFIYAYTSGTGRVTWHIVNLETGSAHARETDAAGVQWPFSPCGNGTSKSA